MKIQDHDEFPERDHRLDMPTFGTYRLDVVRLAWDQCGGAG